MRFKKSRFVVIAPSENEKNTIHLYHTLYDHHLTIEEADGSSVSALFEKLEIGAELSDEEVAAAAHLARMDFVVSQEMDEQELFERWYSTVLQERGDSLVVHVTTTMACNMRCTYCMEQKRLDQSLFMEKEVAEGTSAWIKRRIKSSGARRLSLIFFGGEPLLNSRAIESVSGELSEFCREDGISFKAGAITNGTLLTAEMQRRIVRAGLSWVKVTLDGDNERHDKNRVYKNGRGTFYPIWINLADSNGDLGIFIGGNFSDDSEQSYLSLISRLAGATWKGSIVDVRFKPVMPSSHVWTPSSAGCNRSAFNLKQIGKMLDLRKAVRKAGLPTIDDPNLGPCDFYRNNVVTVGARGELYPCAGFVGLDDCVSGSIFSDEPTEFGRRIRNLRSWDEKCEDCSYLPICAGGCRLPAFLSGGSIEDTVCDLDFYERIVPHLVASYRGADAVGDRMSDIFA